MDRRGLPRARRHRAHRLRTGAARRPGRHHRPPRPDAATTVAAFQDAGVHLLMITGDHPDTARAIATRVGIAGPDSVVTTDPTDGDAEPTVYARVLPEQKLAIVADWQRRATSSR
ncbi:HAD family hydrolase [Actinokineospora soli]|uniref:HAD family hydrolase n=1 Tax=Actinokineospora soli TaxID=1048753 RepID=A0ABW2TQB4_9PSEU